MTWLLFPTARDRVLVLLAVCAGACLRRALTLWRVLRGRREP